MTLLFIANLGNAWGAQGDAPAGGGSNKTVATPKSAGSMKTRS